MEGYFMAQINWFGGTFAPYNWLDCNGSLLPIAEYDALFALIGTTYGGDGQDTFAIPDFRGRMPVGAGTGPGQNTVVLGEMGGSESTTLLSTNLPAHNHAVITAQVKASSEAATVNTPINNVFASTPSPFYDGVAGATQTLRGVSASSGISGGNQPFATHMPSLGLRCVICVFGIFPSRN